jgi:hypothetical protein
LKNVIKSSLRICNNNLIVLLLQFPAEMTVERSGTVISAGNGKNNFYLNLIYYGQ